VARLRSSPALADWPELQARWDELDAGVREIEADGLTETQFVEVLDEATMRVFPEWDNDMGDHTRGRGGLRPRPGFTEVPVTIGREALERRLRSKLGELVPRASLLAYQARVAETIGTAGETCTLLAECAGLWDPEALDAVVVASMGQALHPEPWVEAAADGAPPTWTSVSQRHTPASSRRRLAFVYAGPGVARLLAPLAGWALVEVMRQGVPVSVPVRFEVLDGAIPDAVSERDRRVSAERDRRLGADDGPTSEPGVVVLRKRAGKPLIHVATGGRASDAHALAAALIRIGSVTP